MSNISETLNIIFGINAHFQPSVFAITNLIHSFIHVLNQHVLSAYCVPGPVLVSRAVKQRLRERERGMVLWCCV